MGDEWRWLIGILTTVIGAIVGGTIAGFRSVYNKISAGNADLHRKINSLDQKFVGKDTLDVQFQSIDKQLAAMKEQGDERHTELKKQHTEIKELIEGKLGR